MLCAPQLAGTSLFTYLLISDTRHSKTIIFWQIRFPGQILSVRHWQQTQRKTLKRGTQGIVHPRNKCFSWETGTTTAVLWWSACSSTISSLCTDPSLHTGLSKGRRYWSSPCLINSISSCWRVPSRRQNESIGTAQSELINDCLESKQWGPSNNWGKTKATSSFRPFFISYSSVVGWTSGIQIEA